MSYSTLRADIASWAHRADLDGVIPSFIRNAEAEFNNKLKTREMEALFAETALTDGAVALPSDFESWKVVWTTTNGNRTLKAATNEYIRAQRNDNAGAPSYYALENGNMICYPTAGSVQGVYYKTIPDIETNDTNWLYQARPDLYLYESLRHAHIYMKNADQASQYAALSQIIINDLNSKSTAELISGGPLSARVR